MYKKDRIQFSPDGVSVLVNLDQMDRSFTTDAEAQVRHVS